MPKASVIISFYNKLDFLKLLFAGFEMQTEEDFEIIIADDGSREEVVSELQGMITDIPLKITHIWQEDKGFRKNRILNKAVVASKSDYLIFVDGDCIPHKEFVNEHIRNKKENVCFTGRRVNLSEKITSLLTVEKIKKSFIERNILNLFIDQLLFKASDVEKGLYFKNNLIRGWINSKKRGLIGCNYSIHKTDLLKINGFDERYELPYVGEDTDVQFRLELIGIKISSLNNVAIQYHLYHKPLEKPQKNFDLFEKVKSAKEAFTPFGISKSICPL